MAIENIGAMNTLLSKFDSKDWASSASIEPQKAFNLNDAPSVNFTENNKSFSELLASSIGDVNTLQKEADVAMQRLASGQNTNIAETMLSVEKAEIAFKTMNQVRRKVVDAYKEIMRMQL